jgi:two-component system chemotaxis sensor kinase CheA
MNPIKTYKTVSYVILVLVVVVSFILTNLLLNVISANGWGLWPIFILVLNLVLNFTMFFIVFRFSQLLIEKEAAIQELVNQINKKDEVAETTEEIVERNEQNIDEWVELVVPKNSQNLNVEQFTEQVLANSSKVCDLVQGLFFVKDATSSEFKSAGKYAYFSETSPKGFYEGETISGQVAKAKKIININEIPENYFNVISGLGESKPKYLLIVPVVFKDEAIGIIELASFKPFEKTHEQLFEKLSVLLGKILVKIK